MQLSNYYSHKNDQFLFTRRQASHFAKLVAGDYNPIHDEDARRFCVPGDLLFAVLLAKAGISQKMYVSFSGMISDNVGLNFIEDADGTLSVIDENGKLYLTMTREGENIRNEILSAQIAENYVKFSGMNFPHIMVPLMEESGMMINPDRPMVIYKSMELNFHHLNFRSPTVELINSTMEISGNRGTVSLSFYFKENGEIIGEGKKILVCSGLKAFDKDAVDVLVKRFDSRKSDFLSTFSV